MRLFLGTIKRYLGLESKGLGVPMATWPWHYSFGLGFGICGLTASALWRIPLGAMTSVSFYPGGQIDAYWPGARER